MTVVAGPIASGKTTVFFRRTAQLTRVDSFNVDDRAAALNDGSYQALPPTLVQQAIGECEEFIRQHIRARASFLVETTLRTLTAANQATQARRAGFTTELIYVGTNDPEINVQRAEARQSGGGRDVAPDTVRAVYAASLRNLVQALAAFDVVSLYDNSGGPHSSSLQLEIEHGQVRVVADPPQDWVQRVARAAGLEAVDS